MRAMELTKETCVSCPRENHKSKDKIWGSMAKVCIIMGAALIMKVALDVHLRRGVAQITL